MKFRKKSGICSKAGKIRNNHVNQEVLDGLQPFTSKCDVITLLNVLTGRFTIYNQLINQSDLKLT